VSKFEEQEEDNYNFINFNLSPMAKERRDTLKINLLGKRKSTVTKKSKHSSNLSSDSKSSLESDSEIDGEVRQQ
jgi:hypothetical protein